MAHVSSARALIADSWHDVARHPLRHKPRTAAVRPPYLDARSNEIFDELSDLAQTALIRHFRAQYAYLNVRVLAIIIIFKLLSKSSKFYDLFNTFFVIFGLLQVLISSQEGRRWLLFG